ncbi:MAG: LUD domain-containing protein [Candidatus Woesebacteria bacterium]|nr:MAG: LUD domain-containing protein [Candidatus Woesebacteria bacterium]
MQEYKKVIDALKANGIESFFVENKEEAKKKVLEIIPKKAEVFTMSSVTLTETGIKDVIDESDEYESVRKKFSQMDPKSQKWEMKKMGGSPDWAIGSVHALTYDGKVLIASNTGSQLPAYVYGANHVVWIVGIQKLVNDVNGGIKRIYDYVLPLESVRLNKAHNINTGSFVSKLLIINREIQKDRAYLILVNEKLGF